MNKWRVIIQDCFFPPTCVLCGDAGDAGLDLCASCRATLPFNRTACARCGEPLPAERRTCGQCVRKPPAFDATLALLHYRHPVPHLIQALKFHTAYSHARLLGALLAAELEHRSPQPECIIPVPLHRARYRQRGFNQALEIGRHLERALGIPQAPNCCRRIRPTPPQSQLAAKARRKNLKNAFVATVPPGIRHVALLDDVITTGATLDELASTLKRAGVKRVDAWAVARA